MAMSGSVMATAVVNALKALDPSMTSDQIAQLTAAKTAECNAIVAHITGNAVVSTNDTGTVTSGIGAGGSVVGTGTGTVA